MLTLALCDDDPHQLRQTAALVEGYLAHRDIPGRALAFSTADGLLEAARVEDFDLYILDIVMPERNGIDLGLALRRQGRRGLIIYLTTSPDYALESYAARAFQYLLKPVEPERLGAVLDEALEALGRAEAAIPVKTREGILRLRLDRIVYAELSDHRVCYHLSDGATVETVSLRGSFQRAVAPLLEHPQFTLCAASFLVNLSHVAMVEPGGLRLTDGGQVPLSRGLKAKVTDRWMGYHLKGGAKP